VFSAATEAGTLARHFERVAALTSDSDDMPP
jgi:hypothetical protein